ncbi:hypothetical protein [Streptomyces graminilatus]|uniref:hypothetical protein n=1 Tax=Streptomyces graminilatus TaxID=1464070 RepID=UPI000A93E03F|nr:hypothetical protein [Streptomyces graminilatus]
MVHHVTTRHRRKPVLPSSNDAFELLGAAVAARLPEPDPEGGGSEARAARLPAVDEVRRLAGYAVRLATLGEASRDRVLDELHAALSEDSRARLQAYLDVPSEPDHGQGGEYAEALKTARRIEGAWPDEAGQDFAGPEETGFVIPVPRWMSEAEALELTDGVVGLAPLNAEARSRVLAYLNSLFSHRHQP